MLSNLTFARGRFALLAAAMVASACAGDTVTEPRLPVVATTPRADVDVAPLDPTGAPVAAEPKVYLNTTYPTQTGRSLHVPATGSIQQAIDSARLGDVILLEPGVTYRQYLYLRNKTVGSGWIVIRTKTPDGTLPGPGTRIAPGDAPKLARIVSPTGPAIRTFAGAHHYRLTGLEITIDPALTSTGVVAQLGSGGSDQNTLAAIPHDLVLDRVWVHGNPKQAIQRCVGLNSAATAVIDSYVSECHHNAFDSQAIWGTNTPGPIKIVNNYLEGAGETIMFGGADPMVSMMLPSDIEIRYNHITRPASWKEVWLVKNLIEIKAGQRILIERNVLEGNWEDGQSGTALLFKSTNQNGTCTWCVTRDVTVRYNRIRKTPAGISIASNPETRPAIPASHMRIVHNVLELADKDPAYAGGNRRSLVITGSLTDIEIQHNTVIDEPTDLLFVESGAIKMKRITFTNNVGLLGSYGIHGSSVLSGQATLDKYAPGTVVLGNVMIGDRAGHPYPAGNFYPLATAEVGFSAPASGDYRLAATSPFRGKATDGTDPGANIAAVDAAVQGVTDLHAVMPGTASAPPTTPPPTTPPPTTPPPATTPGVAGALTSAAGGCLATSGSDVTVSTWTAIVSCVAGSAKQTWTLPAVGTAGVITLSGGLCLDASMGAVGSVVFVSPCSPGRTSQQWILDTAGMLKASSTGACVGAVKKSYGLRAELEACTGAATQRWAR